ncbi:MAG: hypothetical protein IJ833_09300, partial [Lachnospiraceae bacterium]|nr:hypothetical protein [Lachnospiraceae bacterium]
VVSIVEETDAQDVAVAEENQEPADEVAQQEVPQQEAVQQDAAQEQSEQAVVMGTTVAPDVVTGGAEGIHGVLNGEGIALQVEDDTRREFDVIAMQIPKNIDFVMDPYNLCEKGYVWSDTYVFRNSGETTVKLSLSDIKCTTKDGIKVAGVDASAEDILQDTQKTVRLRLRLDNGDVVNATVTGSKYDIVMAPGSAFSFSVEGDMSLTPESPWMSGDVSISMIYDVQIEEAEE